ncbi:molybdopterin molybdotransferase MoeA [Candidatus Poribacteria bacterium]|nr:molybdopterin molybdotransferase MoeA [Candidatus Poribacteria bacterium]
MQFFKVKTSEELRDELQSLVKLLDSEISGIEPALGRVLATDVHSPVDLPDFNRSIMDGFAVRARDTFGASASSPAYLKVIGEVLMGETTTLKVSTGEAVKIATGGMLPANADAVVMVEDTDYEMAESKSSPSNSQDDILIEVTKAVAPGDNIVRIGEDVRQSQKLLSKGHQLRPQDIGALAGVGILEVEVYRQPTVAIIPTGDEIIPPNETPKPGQIRDINSYSLAGLVRQTGGIPIRFSLIPDNHTALQESVREALKTSDVVLISGGSSVGTRDVALDVIAGIDGAQILAHGVSIRPGKPVIAAIARDKYIFGMPGNPVSAMVVFELFVKSLLQWLSGLQQPNWDIKSVKAKLNTNFSSDAGREDYVRVRLIETADGLMAEPVLGKSALISTMVKADGTVKIPIGVEGLEAGEEVTVFLF